ncbi:MAG: hypothetical protein JSV16_13565 [Candidatus Hydrogenedentota bacterium]|nr:MAG: hypothetical protein JSV16_13565 [Candidatus Hydrogenedentota bacterium]
MLILVALLFMLFASMGCSNLTGWQIPGTEKSAVPTTKVYLVLENVETVPEELRPQGEIYVDDAFFGNTSRPAYYRFVGNALVVGSVQIEKEKVHTVEVVFPGYEPFKHTRYFGTLPEYSISFRVKQFVAEPVLLPLPEAEDKEKEKGEEAQDKKWYEFWRWFGE